MHTDHVKSLLPDFLHGNVDESLRKGIESHLLECPDCGQEAEDLKNTLSALQEEAPEAVPSRYFATVVPRIRERLERRGQRSWLQAPLVRRVALPLAVAGLAVALLLQMPFDAHEGTGRSYMSDAETFEPEEVVDMLTQQGELQPLATMAAQEITEATLAGKAFERRMAETFLAHGTTFGFDDLTGISTDQLLNSLDEKEVDALLRKLGERITL